MALAHLARSRWPLARHHSEQVPAWAAPSLLSEIWWLPVLAVGRPTSPCPPHRDPISMGSGAATLFWFDRWAGDTPFAARFPDLFSIAVDPSISVERALID